MPATVTTHLALLELITLILLGEEALYYVIFSNVLLLRRSQWLRSRRHELSLFVRTLGSWFRIPLKAWMYGVRLFCVCVVLRAGSGLATG
jgi:hypothetical protein